MERVPAMMAQQMYQRSWLKLLYVMSSCVYGTMEREKYIQHDDLEALALFAEDVLDRYLDVLKGDVRRTRSSRVRGLDRLGLNVIITLNEEHGDALLGLDSDAKVVGRGAWMICNG